MRENQCPSPLVFTKQQTWVRAQWIQVWWTLPNVVWLEACKSQSSSRTGNSIRICPNKLGGTERTRLSDQTSYLGPHYNQLHPEAKTHKQSSVNQNNVKQPDILSILSKNVWHKVLVLNLSETGNIWTKIKPKPNSQSSTCATKEWLAKVKFTLWNLGYSPTINWLSSLYEH